jgi:TRAP-type C4-dicarboxylate transport system permease small subunit
MIFLLIIISITLLQIFISKKQNKWLGLILPAISLLFSIMAVLGLVSFTTLTEQSGKIILNVVQIPKVSILLTALFVFVLYNIPTSILLGIYYACREKIKRNREMHKMSVQDLG